ncbi:uncharacterized protein [Drosophila takahashii]|uniref:uncharacterized protein n=1 Tax=Drosophila takahashii TaxID=29030 RepID=UPI0038992B5A
MNDLFNMCLSLRVKPSDFNLGFTAGSYSPSNFEPNSLKRDEDCNQEAVYGKLPASDTGSTNSAMSLDCKVTSEDCAQSFDCTTEGKSVRSYSHTHKSPKSFTAESKEASQEARKVRTDCFEVTKQSTSHEGHLHKLSDVSRKPIAISVNGQADGTRCINNIISDEIILRDQHRRMLFLHF